MQKEKNMAMFVQWLLPPASLTHINLQVYTIFLQFDICNLDHNLHLYFISFHILILAPSPRERGRFWSRNSWVFVFLCLQLMRIYITELWNYLPSPFLHPRIYIYILSSVFLSRQRNFILCFIFLFSGGSRSINGQARKKLVSI